MSEEERDNVTGEEANEQDETDSVDSEQDSQAMDVSDDSSPLKLTVDSVVEAVLFASDEPLSADRIAKIVETGVKQVREAVNNLNERYESGCHAFRIEQIAGGYQILTLSEFNGWLSKLLRVRDESKLTAAAMETLAIIAYRQPIIRADIEAIRGVSAGEMIRGLMQKGLVKIVGKAEVLGRPMLYGTTKKFLEVFGLNSLKDLPQMEEFKKVQKEKVSEEPQEEQSEEETENSESQTQADPVEVQSQLTTDSRIDEEHRQS